MNFKFLTATGLALSLCLAAPAMARPPGVGGGNNKDPLELVPYTGKTHLVVMVGKGVFPEETFAQDGDRIFFVNKSQTAAQLQATDRSWDSGSLSYNQGYVLLVQALAGTEFEAKKITSMTGEFKRQAPPDEVNYPDSEASLLDLLALIDVPVSTLNTLLSDLGLTEGLLSPVTNPLGGLY